MKQNYITAQAPLPPSSWGFIQSPLKLKQGFSSWPPWGQAPAARMSLRAEMMRRRQPCLWHEKQEWLRCGCEPPVLPKLEWPWTLVGCLWMKGKAGRSEHKWSKVRKQRWEKGKWGSGKKRHDSLLLVLGTLAQSTPSPLCWMLSRQWAGSLRTYKLSKRCMCDGEGQPCASETGWGHLESAPGSATTSTDCLGWCWHSHQLQLARYLRIFTNWHLTFPSSPFTVWTVRTRDAFPSYLLEQWDPGFGCMQTVLISQLRKWLCEIVVERWQESWGGKQKRLVS